MSKQITCQVIEDLLPLYEDQCCSEDTVALVETHLSGCEACRKKSILFAKSIEAVKQDEEAQAPDVKVIQKGVRKVFRWRTIGKTLILAILVVVLGIIPGLHALNGNGLTYTNIGQTLMARRYIRAMIERDYDKALGCMDIKTGYKEIEEIPADESIDDAIKKGAEDVLAKGESWYEEQSRLHFLDQMSKLELEGFSINKARLLEISRYYKDEWSYFYLVDTSNSDQLYVTIITDKDGITGLEVTMNVSEDKNDEKWIRWLDRQYRMPYINETVYELLYGQSDFDWTNLFD